MFRIHDGDDNPSHDILDEKRLVRNHFSGQLDGKLECFETLVERTRVDPCSLSAHDLDSVDASQMLDFLPSHFQLLSQFHGTPCNAFGEDAIPGQLIRRFPGEMSLMLYPVVFKSCVRLSPPLQWRGGMPHELFKNKGSSKYLSHYRDVLLSDHLGKNAYKLVRKQLLPYVQGLVGYFQFGSGFNGGETAFAHLTVRLFVDYLKNLKASGMCIFLDVASAFASLLRRIVFNVDYGDEQWFKLLHNNGFDSSSIEAIDNLIKSFHDNHLHGLSPPALPMAFMNANYSNSWFTTEHLCGAVATHRGSHAGSISADILYASAFAKVLHTFSDALRHEDLLT